MWPFKRTFAPITTIPDEWAVAIATRGDQRLIIRIAKWAWPIRGHPDYPWRIGVAAPFPHGFDSNRVNDEDSPFTLLEADLERALCIRLASLPLVVITGESFREHVFHTRDAESVRPGLDAVCAKYSHIGAAYILEHDPKWSTFQHLCGGRKP